MTINYSRTKNLCLCALAVIIVFIGGFSWFTTYRIMNKLRNSIIENRRALRKHHEISNCLFNINRITNECEFSEHKCLLDAQRDIDRILFLLDKLKNHSGYRANMEQIDKLEQNVLIIKTILKNIIRITNEGEGRTGTTIRNWSFRLHRITYKTYRQSFRLTEQTCNQIEQNERDIITAAEEFQIILDITVLVGVTMAVWAGYIMARALSRPIYQLTNSMKQLSDGNLAYRIPLSEPGIVGEFVQSFNKMGACLEESSKQLEHAYNESKQLHKQIEFILGATNTGLDIIDSKFDIHYVDPTWQKVYGDPNGRKCYEYFMNATKPCPDCGAHKAIKTLAPVITEEQLPGENNRPIQVTSIPFRDKNGDWLVAEVNVDISERKELEESLRAREELLSATLRSIGDGVIVCNVKGEIANLNTVAEQLTGWSVNEAKGCPIEDVFQIVNSHTRQKAENPIRRSLQDGIIVGLANHSMLIARGGNEYQISDSCAPVRTQDGKVVGAVLVFRDVSKEYLQREALRESEEKFKTLVANIPGVTYRCRPDGDWNLLFISERIEELTGYPSTDFINNHIRSYKSIIHPDDALRVCEVRDLMVAKNLHWDIEYRIIHHGGEVRWVCEKGAVVKNKDGNNDFLDGVIFDETRRKKAEARIRQNEIERKKVENNIIQMEKMASLGQLAAGVAHEINNPVGFIKSNLGTLKEYISVFCHLLNLYSKVEVENCPSIREQIKTIKQEEDLSFVLEDAVQLLSESLDGTERVHNIVQGLKSFARADEQGNKRKSVDVNNCIESTLKLVWNELKYKCEVIKELQPLPIIDGDSGQINQVLMNLLVNAAHAIEDKGTVSIKTHSEDNRVVIEIIDSGKGMSEEVASHIFEPFFTTKDVGQGTGLGLSISHGIIEKHGGTIKVYSEVGKGTTFIIHLPFVKDNT